MAIVLARPRFPENIGAAARAMKNMGFSHLILVRPEDRDPNRIAKMATAGARDIVENMEVFDTLPLALAPFNYVVGTTARVGSHRKTLADPAVAAEKLIPISVENRIAVVFGPEDRGLSTEDIRLCHLLVTIPTLDFSSLNLAQSVMLFCYEMFRAGAEPAGAWTPRLARRHELDGMYASLKDMLTRIGFINRENPEHWVDNIRRFLNRLPLTGREVKIIRGVCRQIDWYTEKRIEKMKQEILAKTRETK